MNPNRFFIPGQMMGNQLINGRMAMPGNIGLLSRISAGIKNINWKGLLNGANKTINVVNQTIPLIRQTKPLVDNVRSMIKLTKAFGKETISKENHTLSNNRSNKNIIVSKNITNDDYPTFFI